MSKFLAILFTLVLGTGLCHHQTFTMSDPISIEGPSDGVLGYDD